MSTSYPWDHGRISRQAAEELLLRKSTDGSFLVRESESVSDAHVLSLWHGHMVHHFRIHKKDNKFTVQASDGASDRLFSELAELIELFKQPGQGLPCALKEPIIKESASYMDHDSDEDEREPEMQNDCMDCEGGIEPSENVAISSMFIDKMSEMDTSGLDEQFCNNVREYLNKGFARDGTRVNTATPALDLQQLIVSSANDVGREVKEFLKKIMFLQTLFSPEKDAGKLMCVACTATNRNQSQETSAYDEFVNDLAKCVAGVRSLKVLAQKAHQEYSMKTQQSQTRTFEVNTCGNFKTKAFLKVDITEGKIWFMKNETDTIEDCSVVDHDKILQLVKDPGIPKLTFKFDKSSREYVFKDVQARENLCQLAHHMMNLHSPSRKELKQISVFIGTWNMGSVGPPNIKSWLRCNGSGVTINDQESIQVIGHDIYAFGTQESSISENAWISRIKMSLKGLFTIDYKTVAVQSLWGIRLVILVKPEHKNRISRVERSSVKTGIANKLGNKGGVGISFDFMSTSFCFINTHLASGNEDLRKQRRRQNYLDILKGLSLGRKRAYDLTNQFHHVFWFGDLNYRIDLKYDDIMKVLESPKPDFKSLMKEDQLKKEQLLENVFFEFCESDLRFPPTYRYKRGTRSSYDHIKVKRCGTRINVPSWCDRVLWKSFPEISIKQISYGCTDDIDTSDHSPVFASFEVGVISQFVASQDQTAVETQMTNPSCKIFFHFIEVKVNTVSKTNFYLEFNSVCLDASQKSKIGKEGNPWDGPCVVNSSQIVTKYYKWDAETMPKLNPILDDPEYLKGQHLLIAVKSEAGDESYGECVISLKRHLFHSPQDFHLSLTHGGVKTGEIKPDFLACGRVTAFNGKKPNQKGTLRFRGKMNVQNAKHLALRRPVTRGKTDAGVRKPASSPNYRPFSCVAPPVVKTIPDSKKSASLGRRTQRIPPFYQGHADEQSDQRYITVDELDSNPENLSTQSENERLPPPLPEKSSSVSENDTLTPPPLPKKTNKVAPFPASVIELLSRLRLEVYLNNLEDNGFDNIAFLEDISDEDLADTGITDLTHRKQILDEVLNLKKLGLFNA